MKNIAGPILGTVEIAATMEFCVYVHWRIGKTLLAIFWLVSSLQGGDTATGIYEDIQKTKQVGGIPYRTKDGKWAIDWSISPYKEKAPKPYPCSVF
jgi:hypothetical protein